MTRKLLKTILKDTPILERKVVKGLAVAESVKQKKYTKGNLEIEIVRIKPTPGGVQVLARAWREGVQLGFGKDGTVDIERFNIYNPPTMVTSIDNENKRTLVEDCEGALIEVLANTIGNKQEVSTEGKIIKGKIGNTTAVIFGETGDGGLQAINTTWASTRNQATGSTNTNTLNISLAYVSPTDWRIRRSQLVFNTSVIAPGAEISAGSVKITQYHNAFGGTTRTINLVDSTKTNASAIVDTDYSAMGTTRLSTDLSVPNPLSGNKANRTFALNSAGLLQITKGGFTFFGAKDVGDIDNIAPSTQANNDFYTAEASGTVDDPTLTVEYTSFPVVATNEVTNITQRTATFSGEVISDAGKTITQRGFVYGQNPNPTTANLKLVVSGTIGAYSGSVSNLFGATTYYVRAYAINADGTKYGEQEIFNTLNVDDLDLQKETTLAQDQNVLGQINVTGTTGTITIKLGSTGSEIVINAGDGVSNFSGIYSGLSGITITRSEDFDGTIDDLYYVNLPLGSTVNWELNTVSLVTPIPSEVFFKRVESDVFNSFRFYRYLDLLFKDLDGYVTVTVRQEREDNTVANEKTFSVGNPASGIVSPFQKKRISFLIKNQAVIIGLSNSALNETFSIAKYLLIGDQKNQKMFSTDKIISM